MSKDKEEKKSVEEVLPKDKKHEAEKYPEHLHSPLHNIQSKKEVTRETENDKDDEE